MRNPLLERRLSEFVDRDHELADFVRMLESDDRPIMIVWGEAGIGKTSLLMRIIHECAVRKIRKVVITWKDTSAYDYLAVMRRIRDDVGPEHFPTFTDLVNFYHEAGYQPKLNITLALQGASVAQGLTVSDGAMVGDIAGVVIKDSMFQIPRIDLDLPEAERCGRLTQRFLHDLQATVANEPLVVLLDAAEKMSVPTEQWVWNELLDPVRNGTLSNVRFVVCGHKPPPEDRDWQLFIRSAGLKPLGRDDVTAYLRKRAPDVNESSLADLTSMILAVSRGSPAPVASTVDAFLQFDASEP